MARLRDVAKAANVSLAAASYAFSSAPEKREKLSAGTLERIRKVARELRYTPSIQARAFSLRRNFAVALLLPSHCAANFSQHNLRMFHGVSSAVTASDYNLQVTFGCQERFLHDLEQHRFDGVVMVSKLAESPVITTLASSGVPLVLLGRAWPPESGVGSVTSDFTGFLREVALHFRTKGCRRVKLFCRQHSGFASDREFTAAFRTVAEEEGWSVAVAEPEPFAPVDAEDCDALVFRTLSPAAEEFLRCDRRPAAVWSDRFSAPRGNLWIGYYDSIAIGRKGVEMLFGMMDAGRPAAALQVPYRKVEKDKTGSTSYQLDF